MGDEKRVSKRLAIALDSMYRRLTDEEFSEAAVVNINYQGICVFVKDVFEPKTQLELRVSLETGELVFLIGEVRWQRDLDEDTGTYKTGLKILDGRGNDLAQFQRYYNLRMLYPPEEA